MDVSTAVRLSHFLVHSHFCNSIDVITGKEGDRRVGQELARRNPFLITFSFLPFLDFTFWKYKNALIELTILDWEILATFPLFFWGTSCHSSGTFLCFGYKSTSVLIIAFGSEHINGTLKVLKVILCQCHQLCLDHSLIYYFTPTLGILFEINVLVSSLKDGVCIFRIEWLWQNGTLFSYSSFSSNLLTNVEGLICWPHKLLQCFLNYAYFFSETRSI